MDGIEKIFTFFIFSHLLCDCLLYGVEMAVIFFDYIAFLDMDDKVL